MRSLRGCLIVVIFLAVVETNSAGNMRIAMMQMPPVTIRRQIADATVIVFGRFESARKNVRGGNETDLVVHDVIKSHPLVKDRKVFVLPREVTSADMYVVFADVHKGKLDFYRGVQADRDLVAHMRKIMKLDPKKPAEILRFYFDYLQDASYAIHTDAHLEFSQASPAIFGEVACKLPAGQLRTWINDPKADAYHHYQYTLLLSYCGVPKDADDIAKMLEEDIVRVLGHAK